MSFSPWTLLVDVGIVSLLLLLGKFLRAKVRVIQKLFIPPSLLAGFFGLIFGPELLGWLPLSGNMGTYAGILIALVFSCIPFTSAGRELAGSASRLRDARRVSYAPPVLRVVGIERVFCDLCIR